MKMFELKWKIHCEMRRETFSSNKNCTIHRAHYTIEFDKWLKENNIRVAMHNLATMDYNMSDPWIIFKHEEDEMFFKLMWT